MYLIYDVFLITMYLNDKTFLPLQTLKLIILTNKFINMKSNIKTYIIL